MGFTFKEMRVHVDLRQEKSELLARLVVKKNKYCIFLLGKVARRLWSFNVFLVVWSCVSLAALGFF